MEHAFLSRPEPRITGNPKRGPGRPWEFVAESLVNPDIDDGMALGGSNPISTSQHVRVSIPRRYCIVSVVCLIEFHLYIEPVFRIKDPSGVAGSMEAVDEFESAQARQMTFVHFMGASNSLQLGAASYSTVVFSGYFPTVGCTKLNRAGARPEASGLSLTASKQGAQPALMTLSARFRPLSPPVLAVFTVVGRRSIRVEALEFLCPSEVAVKGQRRPRF